MKNRKRFLFPSVLLFLFLLSSIWSGGILPHSQLSIRLTVEGEPVFSRTYEISFSHAFTLDLLYRGDRKEMLKKKFSGNYKDMFGYLNGNIESDLNEVCARIERAPENAKAFFGKDGTFTYAQGRNGRRADVDATLEKLVFSDVCEVVCVDVPPAVTAELLRKNTVKIASFSTSYATSSPARKKNVELAATRLNGKVVPSGGELSFNETVGARTTENGFCEAKVIVNGEYTTGVGGGVCQVSTTLYNAWLLTGQSVPVSRAHSLVPSYVRPGLDAMVSETGDLVVRNDSRFPLYIHSEANGSLLTFILFGPKPEYEIVVTNELVRSIPYEEYETIEGDADAVLSYPKPRAIYRSFRLYRENGREIVKEVLRLSDYLPQKGKKSVRRTDNPAEIATQ